MAASELLEDWALKQGWDADTQLAYCLQYIDSQQDDQCFEDFLSRRPPVHSTETTGWTMAEAELAAAAYERAIVDKARTVRQKPNRSCKDVK